MKKLFLSLILLLINYLSVSCQNWEKVGAGLDNNVYDLIEYKDKLYACGRIFPSVKFWDSNSWLQTNSIFGIPTPLTLEIYDDSLYASGDSWQSYNPAKVVKLNNGGWIQQGGDFKSSPFNSIKKIKSHGEYLYAGGLFEEVGNIKAKNIARWDGIKWDSVSHGVKDWIVGMDVFKDNLVVCYQTHDTTYHYKLTLWNNIEWINLDSLFQYKNIRLLKVIDSVLYYHSIETINGITFNDLCTWDGNNVVSIGDSLFNDIRDIIFFNGSLYVACSIKTSNPNAVKQVVRKLNGSTWETVGEIFDNPVLTLEVFEGKLFCAGFFKKVGDKQVGYIAKLNEDTTPTEDITGTTLPFSLYPNPTHDDLLIENSNESMEAFVFDFNGQLVFSQLIPNGGFVIPLAHLANGIYFIELKTKDNTYIQKVIKQ